MIAALVAAALLFVPNPPSFDVGGPGPFFNLGSGETAKMNAIAHMWFGTLVPMTGYYVGDRLGDKHKGLVIGALSCIGFVLVRETFFHGATPGPEIRTDLVSGLLPPLIVLGIDALSR